MLPALLAGLMLAGPPSGAASGPGSSWDDCADCHEEISGTFGQNVHSRVRGYETRHGRVGCEGCHGDVGRHLDSGSTEGLVSFGEDLQHDSEACLDCHSRHGISAWFSTAHSQELGCTDCHTTHERTDPAAACSDCHADSYAQFYLPSHHPLHEGKMDCSSCHDVHRPTEAALKTDERVNDLCLRCHSAQQGPYMFEHEPVVEDCRQCHTPHGAVADNLLTANQPFVCLQCHEMHFHAGLKAREEEGVIEVGGLPYQNNLGEHGYQQAFTTKCTQCHTQIHGSDLPSQGITSRGQSFTR